MRTVRRDLKRNITILSLWLSVKHKAVLCSLV